MYSLNIDGGVVSEYNISNSVYLIDKNNTIISKVFE